MIPVCVAGLVPGWCNGAVGGEVAVFWGSALDVSPAHSVFPHNKAAQLSEARQFPDFV